jgi:hypothetical protein
MAVLVAGCGAAPAGPDGPQQNVLRCYPPYGYLSGDTWIQRILDLGFMLLHNNSGSTVQLRSVQLVSPGPYVRLLSATACVWQQTGVGDTQTSWGDLPKECPGQYIPHPLSDAVTKPHSDSAWTVILALRFTRPGNYRIWRVKLSYWADGHPGWQYYSMYDTVYAHKGYGPRLKSMRRRQRLTDGANRLSLPPRLAAGARLDAAGERVAVDREQAEGGPV